jgi:hypothetical protein
MESCAEQAGDPSAAGVEMGTTGLEAVLESLGDCHTHEIVDWEIQPAEDGHTHELDQPAWKFGLRICYMPEKDATGIFADLISNVTDEQVMLEKAFRLNSSGGERYSVPIAHAEIDIPDQEFSNFTADSYDVYCLVPLLIDTPAYQTWFRYIFPMPRYISLLTIYSMMCFYDSMFATGYPEDGGDLFEKDGGNRWRSTRNWDRSFNADFRESRKKAEKTFMSIYNSTQTDYSETSADEGNDPLTLSDLLKPMFNYDLGTKWWQTGRRIKNNPFSDEEC